MSKGTLYIISAPSGTGKSTIVGEILKSDPNIWFSVSATTRSPRPEDKEGVTYFFRTREEFESLIESGGMLEHAEFCGNYYGTPKQSVFDKLNEGRDVILEIETVGAYTVMDACPDAVSIFILPPSLEVLRHRLEKRGTDSEEVIDRRISEAAGEIKKAERYDYVVVNGELEKAIDDVRAVMKAAKKMTKLNNETIKGVLEKC